MPGAAVGRFLRRPDRLIMFCRLLRRVVPTSPVRVFVGGAEMADAVMHQEVPDLVWIDLGRRTHRVCTPTAVMAQV